MRRVTVAGVAPGQTVLDAKTLAAAAQADLIVGAKRFLALLSPTEAAILEVEGQVSAAVDRVAANPKMKALFLASGDPGFFGIGALLVKKLGSAEVEIFPAVSSLQYAFARAGSSWSDAALLSLHAKPLDSLAAHLGAPKIGLLTDRVNTPAAIARYLIEGGCGDMAMTVCSDLGLEGEKLETGKPSDFAGWEGSPLNVVLLAQAANLPRFSVPGVGDAEFRHPRGRITKRLVRSAALALLELPQAGVLWDIGAGSGSVGIEAALLRPGLVVCSVEKDAEALGDIHANKLKFRVAALKVVEALAPEGLADLPAPDRVFIGGSGGNLASILDISWERLPLGGLILLSTVLAETQADALAWARSNNIEAELTQLSVSHSKRTGTSTRLAAQDPVTLITLRKEKASDG